MKITKSQLSCLIESFLLEENQNKIFKGDYYTLGEVKGASLIYKKSSVAYFLLPKNSEGKNTGKFNILTYEKFKEIKDTTWVSDLDDYSDFSQNSFFKHLKNNRIVYGVFSLAKKEQSSEKEQEIGLLVADTVFDASIAVGSLFPLTAGISMAASIGRAAVALAQNNIADCIAWTIGIVPGIGGPVRAALKPLMSTATRKGVIQLSANAGNLSLGIEKVIKAIEENKSELEKAFIEIIGVAKDKSSDKDEIKFTPSGLYNSFIEFFNKLLNEIKEAEKAN